MTATELRAELAALGMTQGGFAAFCGLEARSIRRWCCEERPVPPWVPVMLRMIRQCREHGLAA